MNYTFDQYHSAVLAAADADRSVLSEDQQAVYVAIGLVAAVSEFNESLVGYTRVRESGGKILRCLALLAMLCDADFSALANRSWDDPEMTTRMRVTFADYRRRRGSIPRSDRSYEMLAESASIAQRVSRVVSEGGAPLMAERSAILRAASNILVALDCSLVEITLESAALADAEAMKREVEQ